MVGRKEPRPCRLFVCMKTFFEEPTEALHACDFEQFVKAIKMVSAQEVMIDTSDKKACLICTSGVWRVLFIHEIHGSIDDFILSLTEALKDWGHKIITSW